MSKLFGWDLPPGVTSGMIDRHFGDDEEKEDQEQMDAIKDSIKEMTLSRKVQVFRALAEELQPRVIADAIVESKITPEAQQVAVQMNEALGLN